MAQRNIVEEHEYRKDLSELVPDARQADEILESANEFFRCRAEEGNRIDGTRTWTHTIWDIPNGRYLLIYYEMTDTEVTLLSIREFSMIG